MGAGLRVGLIGARFLGGGEAAVAAQARTVFEAIAGQAHGGVRVLSSLAEGADQVLVEAALEGWGLFVPLPFAAEAFLGTIEDTGAKERFPDLLRRAGDQVLVLDGVAGDAPGPERDRAYEAAGRFIVRNCDLIVAVWDGKPGGVGGTAQTIRYAANFGPPVIVIHLGKTAAESGAVSWIEDAFDLRAGGAAQGYEGALKTYLGRLQEPPGRGRHHHAGLIHGVVEGLVWLWYKACRQQRPSPLQAFRKERPLPDRRGWRFQGWFIQSASLRRRRAGVKAPEPVDAVAAHWRALRGAPDDRANEYSVRYRSSYVWALLLGGWALSWAAVSLTMHEALPKALATAMELIALVAILVLAVLDKSFGWHRKSIDYRLLGELCRKQQALAPLGWAVPRAGAWCTTEEPAHSPRDMPHLEQIEWVSWLFSAMVRSAPLPTGVMDQARVGALRDAVVADLLDGQIDYHDRTGQRLHLAGRHLVWASEGIFVLVAGLVAWKLWLLFGPHPLEDYPRRLLVFGLAGVILAAAAAALFGVRAYAELELMAEQSALMHRALTRTRKQLKQLRPDGPLASQALGSATAGVATLMLEDVQGWARVFRGKVVET